MFARPYISSKSLINLQNPNASVFVWVDQSPSMEYIESSLTNGQRAFDLIDSIAAQLPYSAKLFNYDYGTEDFIGYQKRQQLQGQSRSFEARKRFVSALKAHKTVNHRTRF
jgi:hypothetical protein